MRIALGAYPCQIRERSETDVDPAQDQIPDPTHHTDRTEEETEPTEP
jgi:hypothetical protein